MIAREAGDPRASPSFVEYGVGSAASHAAVAELRPHVERHHVPRPDRRQNARSDRSYLDAVRRAIDGFRRWWHGGRAGGASHGDTIVEQVRDAVWHAHWHETEAQRWANTEKIRQDQDAERLRQEQRTQQTYRPQLVETTPSRKRKPGPRGRFER